MIARTQALTGLSFDAAAIRRALKPNIDGDIPEFGREVSRSTGIFRAAREMFSGRRAGE